MKKLYERYMHEWETRLTTRDNNRVVRPFEFGREWVSELPQAQDVESWLSRWEAAREGRVENSSAALGATPV